MTLGLVGTRCSVPEEFLDQAQAYCVFVTKILDDFTSLQVVWSHWYGNGVSPGAGKNLTIDAELEHPAGVFTKIKFSGANIITTGPLTNVTSDPIAVSGVSGTFVKVRGLYTGCCDLHRGPNATIGEGVVFPATGLSLTTLRTTAFNANFFYSPSAVIGTTNKQSVIILGDSHASGLGDNYNRADGSYGTVGGALNDYPWAQMVQWGGSPADYLAGAGALQAELVQYATDVIGEFGGNHLFDSDTAATTLAAQASIKALYPTKRYHLTTIGIKTTTTDAWATLGNQTLIANEAELQSYNAQVLANAMGYGNPIDLASIMESSRGSGKWRVDGTANKYTIDGVHPSPYCYGLFPGAGFTLDPLTPPVPPVVLPPHTYIPLPGGSEFDTTLAPTTTSILGLTEQPITLHVPLALSRLIEFWKNKPNLRGLIADYHAEAQEIENMFWDVIVTRSLDYAGTDQLDHIGAIVGEQRNGRGNANYRLRIRVRIRINNSLGRAQDVITVVRMLTTARFQFVRVGVAGFKIIFTEAPPDDVAAELPNLIEQTAGSGFGIQYLAVATDPGPSAGALYGWEGDPTLNATNGYGWESDVTIGGRYGYSVIY